MPTALVTGANGFIGSHLVRELISRGYEVRGLVRHTSDLSALDGLPIPLFLGDLRRPETLAAPVQGVEYVFHLGAELLATDRETFDQVNYEGTLNLLRAVELQGADTVKRFLFVSSLAAAGPAPGPTPIDETSEPRPISWYGASKHRAEVAVHACGDRFPVTVVRLGPVYGERERDISQAYPAIGQGIQPKLGLDPKYSVMLYVGDAVRGMVDAAESAAAANQTYYLTHPEVLTSEAIARTIGEVMGKPDGLVVPVPMVAMRLLAPFAEVAHHLTRRRPATTRDKARELSESFWLATPSKAKRDFGWEAGFDLRRGLERTIAYFRREQQDLREMPLEQGPMAWGKYVIVAALVGSLIEITAAIGKFYWFTPRWGSVAVALGAFGVGLGSLARLLRTRPDAAQFAIGTLITGVVEGLNEFRGLPFLRWHFAPGWPLGITQPWLRPIVLGGAGGVFILVVNALMRLLYRYRLRVG